MQLVVPQIRKGGVDTVFVMVCRFPNMVRYQLTSLIAVRNFQVYTSTFRLCLLCRHAPTLTPPPQSGHANSKPII